MNRYADIECKSPVIQHVHGVKHGRAEEQLMERHFGFPQEQRRVGQRPLSIVREDRNQDKLHQRDKQATVRFMFEHSLEGVDLHQLA